MRPTPSIGSLDSLGEAYQLMRTHAVRHLPVVHEGKLVGVLTERDVLEYRAALGFGEAWRDYGVTAAMSRSPRTVDPHAPMSEVAGRLAVAKVGALPVVERGAVLGIVTVADVLAPDVQPGKQPPAPINAADAMTPGPFTATADELLFDATKRMRVHGIRHLPVVDELGHVVGMLSERDVRTAIGDPARFVLAGARVGMRVKDAMTRAPITVTEHRPIAEIAKMFEDGRIGAVPVIDGTERLVGILSYVDALHALAAAHATEVRTER
jgi:acetoin utilization protein AcuB